MSMRIANVGKSVGLVGLLLTSLMIGLVTVPTASAINETSSGSITTTETWSGTHTLTGNVTVAEGAKLVINAGTTVNIPAGAYIDVEGAICAGSASCGASQGSASSPVRFEWATPSDYDVLGWCYQQGSQLFTNPDAACGSGIVIRSTINQASTGMSFVSFNNAYGHPTYVQSLQNIQYGTLIFEGSSTNLDNLAFSNINTSNIIALDFAAPTIRDSTFTLGDDGRGYDASAVRAYDAGAGILSTLTITGSTFTGDTEAQCGQGGGIGLIYAESSYVTLDNLELKENGYGVFLKQSSGSFGNSTIDTKCNAIDTNAYKATGNFAHTLYLDNNVITTEEGAGITAYDGAIVTATSNTISGASGGSGFGIRDSTVSAHGNTVGPIEGFNGFWVYGESEVEIENNTIQDTAKEPIQIGEYHYKDGGNYPGPSPNRAYIANNIISNNTGTCNSQFMYDGDFNCPAIHVFTSSATIVDNTVTNNAGDGLRIKGSIVNVQRNTVEAGQFAVNISHYDEITGPKYGSIGYFSGNTWTNATQVYNITESRVTVQSEYIPDAGGDYTFPVMLSWLSAECPYVLDECLLLPDTAAVPPRDMPLAIELVNNSTVFSFADLQNFDASKIHVQNQNTAWGSQVRQGELVRYQVKAKNSNVAGATVVIKDATGLPLYELTTDSFGMTQQVSLPSDFLLDRNWNHIVGETGVTVPGTDPSNPVVLDEDTCSDGYDNDGDTFVDDADPDCANGRELPFYIVEAYKFGKGKKEFDFVLNGQIDDVISLDNVRPSVTVEQNDGTSFAINAVITGTAWDGQSGPYPLDIIAYDRQFGLVERVEIQPPGSTDWYYAVDTSGANGELTKENHPFKSWSFEWDLSAHPDGESDVTFRIRSYDGLDYSPIEVRKFKLNLVPPTLYLNEPLDGSTHSNGKILFTGTASDPYSGTWGSDIQDIWFDVTGPNGYTSHFAIDGSVAWAYDWNFEELESGEYTFEVWASDSDFCDDVQGTCVISTRTVTVLNDNIIPIVDLLEPDGTQAVRAESDTQLIGFASDGADGTITRVEIEILDLASGLILNDGPGPVTSFTKTGPGYSWSANWDTSKLKHEGQYEIRVKAYDGEDYSVADVVRITISKPTDANNIPPQFNSTNWPNQITIFCVVGSSSENQCGGGATLDLTQYFNDPDSDDLIIDFMDDAIDPMDDNHPFLIDIDSSGVAMYDPAIKQNNEDIASWTIENVRFVVRDAFDESAVSRSVTFFVQAIEFNVIRDDPSESVTATDPAEFSGTGLPGARIEARSIASESLIKTVIVGDTGAWTMNLSLQDMNDASNDLMFLMDGQTFGGSSEPSSFKVEVGESEEGSKLLLIIGIVVAALLLLAGVGYFFLEFEELADEEFDGTQEVVQEEDPYAWGKKNVPAVPQQPVAAAPVVQPEPVQQSAQHPGWLWDQESNQWVPDPNYQPPNQ